VAVVLVLVAEVVVLVVADSPLSSNPSRPVAVVRGLAVQFLALRVDRTRRTKEAPRFGLERAGPYATKYVAKRRYIEEIARLDPNVSQRERAIVKHGEINRCGEVDQLNLDWVEGRG